MKPSFLVYSGDGVDRTFIDPALQQAAAARGIGWGTVTAQDIRNGRLQDPDALLLTLPGGGSGQAVRDSLGPTGGANIKAAVQDGMALMGICMGGYLLGNRIEYSKEMPGHEKRIFSPLGMFNGLVKGELPLLDYQHPRPLSGWHRANLTRIGYGHQREARLFYWGGGMLIPEAPTPHLMVLARYRDVKDEPIAVAAQRVGQGVAIFSGIHTEVSGALLRQGDNSRLEKMDPADNGRWRQQLAAELSENEAARRYLWEAQMSLAMLAARPRAFTTRFNHAKVMGGGWVLG